MRVPHVVVLTQHYERPTWLRLPELNRRGEIGSLGFPKRVTSLQEPGFSREPRSSCWGDFA